MFSSLLVCFFLILIFSLSICLSFSSLTLFGQVVVVDSGASWGQASAPGGMGVWGHDTQLCGLPLDGGAGLRRRCQGTMPEASTSVANAKEPNHLNREREKKSKTNTSQSKLKF